MRLGPRPAVRDPDPGLGLQMSLDLVRLRGKPGVVFSTGLAWPEDCAACSRGRSVRSSKRPEESMAQWIQEQPDLVFRAQVAANAGFGRRSARGRFEGAVQ